MYPWVEASRLHEKGKPRAIGRRNAHGTRTESAGLPKGDAMKRNSKKKKPLDIAKATLKNLTVKSGVRAGYCHPSV
jgi:hypothetical protein